MPEVTFFKHRRVDGGTRYGITLNQRTICHRYDATTDEDPTLAWFIDVRCLGSKLPGEPRRIREWLVNHGAVIQAGLEAFAKQLTAKSIINGYPILFDVPAAPEGAFVSIAVSAQRRHGAKDLARELVVLSDEWESVIRSIPVYRPASAAS